MPAPANQYERMRRDLDADSTTLPDSEIDKIYDEAAESIPNPGNAQNALARVIALRGMLAAAAKQSDYTQNASSQRSGQVFEHLQALMSYWMGMLEKERAEELSAARFGGLRMRPARIQEWPE